MALVPIRSVGYGSVPPPEQPAPPRLPTNPLLAANRQPRGVGGAMFSPSTRQFFVNGQLVSDRDEASLLSAAQEMDPNARYASPGGDFQPIDSVAFGSYIDKIANPDFGRRVGKNFEVGVESSKELLGAGLRFLGADAPGQAIMEGAQQRQAELSPYVMGLEDIDGSQSRGVLDWFAGIVGQVGPSVVETALTAALGAGAGAVAGGGPNPFTAAGGMLMALSGKEAVKQAMLVAAKKQLAGEALQAGETKLLREQASLYAAALEKNPGFANNVIYGNMTTDAFAAGAVRTGAQDLLKRGRTQAMVGGAGVATIGSGYITGVEDAYREQLEAGTPDRGAAALTGIPYAALDFAPEFLLARRLLGDVGQVGAKQFKDLNGVRAKAGELLKRGAKGAAIGAGTEGLAEGGQEALLLANNPTTDWNSPAALSRLVNAFAAGAAIGGGIGSLANLRDTHAPANILNPMQPVEPTAPAAPAAPANLLTPSAPPGLPPPTGGQVGAARPQYQAYQPGTGVGPALDPNAHIPYAEFTVQPELGAPPPPPIPQQGAPAGQQSLMRPMQALPAPGPIDRGPAAPSSVVVTPPPRMAPEPQPVNTQLQSQLLRRGRSQEFDAAQRQLEAQRASDYLRAQRQAVMQEVRQDQMPEPQAFADPTGNSQQGEPTLPFKRNEFKKVRNPNRVIPDTLSDYDPTAYNQPTMSMFNERMDLIPETGTALTIRGKRLKNNIISWLNSLDDADFERNIVGQGTWGKTKAEVEKTVKSSSNPAKLLKEMRAAYTDAATQPQLETVADEDLTPPKPKKTLKKDKPSEPRGPSESRTREEPRRSEAKAEPARPSTAEPDRPARSESAPRGPEARKVEAPRAEAFSTRTTRNEAEGSVTEVTMPDGKVVRMQRFDGSGSEYPGWHDLDEPSKSKSFLGFNRAEALERLSTRWSNQHPGYSETRAPAAAERTASVKFIDNLERALKKEFDLKSIRIEGAELESKLRLALQDDASILDYVLSNGNQVKVYVHGDKIIYGRSPNKLKFRIKPNEQHDMNIVKAYDKDSGSFMRSNGTPVEPMDHLKVSQMAKAFMSKFKARPNLHVFRNLADLKARNPSLYKRAAAARDEGDFDATEAVGYSFGNDVLVFSDFIHSEQQLRFTLAHETIGHFGIRAVMPQASFEALLNRVFNTDLHIRKLAQTFMDVNGIPKLEAIEEALADEAARLENSLMSRVWAAVKSGLNQIGLKFPDDAARLILQQARRYARYGYNGHFMSAAELVRQMDTLRTEAEGRFLVNPRTLSDFYAAPSWMRNTNDFDRTYQDRAEYKVEGFKAQWKNFVEVFNTTNNMSRLSRGMELGNDLFHRLRDAFQKHTERYNYLTRKSNELGLNDPVLKKANLLTMYGTLFKSTDRDALEGIAADYGELIIIKDGEAVLNPEVLKYNEQTGEFSGPLWDAGVVTPEEFQEGIPGIVVTEQDDNGRLVEKPLDPFKDATATADSPHYKIYLEQRRALIASAVDRARSQIIKAQKEAGIGLSHLGTIVGRDGKHFTKPDYDVLKSINETYVRLARANETHDSGNRLKLDRKSTERAEDFLLHALRVMHEEFGGLKLKDWAMGREGTEQFQTDDFKGLREDLSVLYSHMKLTQTDLNKIQAVMRDSLHQSVSTDNAQMYGKITILAHYTPFVRTGSHYVEVIAEDADGNRVRLPEGMANGLPYFEETGLDKAESRRNELNRSFGKELQEITDETGTRVKVRLRAYSGSVSRSADVRSTMSADEVAHLLRGIGYNLPPEAREKLVEVMTAQDAKARQGLMRHNRPGWNLDMRKAMADHLEFAARISANNIYKPELNDLLSEYRMPDWRGSPNRLRDLELAVEQAPNGLAKRRAEAELAHYSWQYYHSAPRGYKVNIKGKPTEALGRHNDYRESFKRMLAFLESNGGDIMDAPGRVLGSKFGSQMRFVTTTMQLGGSIATAGLNMTSLSTNTIPYLAFYNAKNGFGGGFGMARAAREVFHAVRQLKNHKLADAAYLRGLRENKGWERYGLTEDELEFMILKTEQGVLQAAQANALAGTARGRINNPMVQKALDGWMWFFNYTEQLNRRTTAVTAFRLERERLMAEGMSRQEANTRAANFAEQAANTTQGSYGVLDRPEISRSGLLSYVFMYKQYSIISIELLSALPPKGQLMFLAMLFMMAGVSGFPFADDIIDLLDTLLVRFGFKMPSVEATAAQFFDSVLPGSGYHILNGPLDQLLGITLSSRTGFGDLVPMSGFFLPSSSGTDKLREVSEFLGPAFSATTGIGGMFVGMASLTAESLGLKHGSYTSFSDILRDSPITAARALGDFGAYLDSGAIVNAQGRMIAEDPTHLLMLTRLLGFYPSVASRQNEVVRISKLVGDYQKEIGANFRSAYIKAAMSNGGRGDQTRMAFIRSEVAAWNQSAIGTGLELPNWQEGANKAVLAARKPTAQRYLDVSARAIRPMMRNLMEIYGVEQGDL